MQPVAQASAAPLTQPAAGVSEPQNGCLQAKKIPLAQVQAAMQHRHDPFLLSVLCHTQLPAQRRLSRAEQHRLTSGCHPTTSGTTV